MNCNRKVKIKMRLSMNLENNHTFGLISTLKQSIITVNKMSQSPNISSELWRMTTIASQRTIQLLNSVLATWRISQKTLKCLIRFTISLWLRGSEIKLDCLIDFNWKSHIKFQKDQQDIKSKCIRTWNTRIAFISLSKDQMRIQVL